MFTITKVLLALFFVALAAIVFGMFDLAVSFGTIDVDVRDTKLLIRSFIHEHTVLVGVALGILLLSALSPRILPSKRVS